MSYDHWAGVSDAGMVDGVADATDLADLIGIRDSYPSLRPDISASEVRTIAIRCTAEVLTVWLYRHGAARIDRIQMLRIGIRIVDDHKISTRSIATSCRCALRTGWRIRCRIVDRIYMEVCSMVDHGRPEDATTLEEVYRIVSDLLEPADVGTSPMARWSIGEAWGTPWGATADRADDTEAMARSRYIARHSGGLDRRARSEHAEIGHAGSTDAAEDRLARAEAHDVARRQIHELSRRIRQVSVAIRESPERCDLRAERAALTSERQELQDWLESNLRAKLA